MNLIGQLNAIAKKDDALFSGMQVKQAQLGLVQGCDIGRLDLSTIHKLHNKDQQLTFTGIKNEFIAKAMNAWHESLADKHKK
ncbi:MAG: hypothetical protein WCF95_00005 [bacterium]